MLNLSNMDLLVRLQSRPAAPSAQGPAAAAQSAAARLATLEAAAALSGTPASRPASGPVAAPRTEAPQEGPPLRTLQFAAPPTAGGALPETRMQEAATHPETQSSPRQAAFVQEALPQRAVHTLISPPMGGACVPAPPPATAAASAEQAPRAELVPPPGGRAAKHGPTPPVVSTVLFVLSVLALTVVLLSAL